MKITDSTKIPVYEYFGSTGTLYGSHLVRNKTSRRVRGFLSINNQRDEKGVFSPSTLFTINY